MTTPLLFLNKIILKKKDDNQQNYVEYELCEMPLNQAIDILLDPLSSPLLFQISLDAPLDQVKTLITSSAFDRLIQFKADELNEQTIKYELSTSIGLDALSDDQLNAWMHDAYNRLHPLAVNLEINAEIQNSPILFIHGSMVMSRAQIMCIQLLLIDLASLISTALWVTEIRDGDETIINYTELAHAHALWRKVSPEQN